VELTHTLNVTLAHTHTHSPHTHQNDICWKAPEGSPRTLGGRFGLVWTQATTSYLYLLLGVPVELTHTLNVTLAHTHTHSPHTHQNDICWKAPEGSQRTLGGRFGMVGTHVTPSPPSLSRGTPVVLSHTLNVTFVRYALNTSYPAHARFNMQVEAYNGHKGEQSGT
jgi:hypothetical protein